MVDAGLGCFGILRLSVPLACHLRRRFCLLRPGGLVTVPLTKGACDCQTAIRGAHDRHRVLKPWIHEIEFATR
jgi:hypothetical protein